MKKIYTCLLLAGMAFSVSAQGTQPAPLAYANLDVSNINPTIRTGGDAFWSSTSTMSPGFEVPRGSGNHTIFSGALWLGGKDQHGQLYTATQTYRQGAPADAGYWPGPIGVVQDPAFSLKYDHVWKVSQQEIEIHQHYYANPNYTIPKDILTWPGNGNLANGEARMLAPFIDVDQDGIYTPSLGDYPDIKGDQALYVILNDKGNRKEPHTPPMHVEVHAMYYGFNNAANTPVFNTIFTEYRIINRGQIHFQDYYVGLWTDFDIGYFNDDFVGCDTTTNRYFGYNGDNLDGDGSTYGYGANPPVQSVTLLNQQLTHFLYYNNDANKTNGNPQRAADFYNYLHGHWSDSSNLTYGGSGTNQQNQPVKFMFPGNPVTGVGWSEVNNLTAQPNVPSDRRALGSFGPFNFAPGQEITFTTASTFSRGSSNLNSVALAQRDALAVKHFFETQPLKPKPSGQPPTQALTLYPNPATTSLQFKVPANLLFKPATVVITDATGREVLKTAVLPTQVNATLDIQKLLRGVYQVSVTSEDQILTSRLAKL